MSGRRGAVAAAMRGGTSRLGCRGLRTWRGGMSSGGAVVTSGAAEDAGTPGTRGTSRREGAKDAGTPGRRDVRTSRREMPTTWPLGALGGEGLGGGLGAGGEGSGYAGQGRG